VNVPDVIYRSRVGDVYHIDPQCPVGRLIPPEWRVPDHGDLRLCPTCRARLEARPADPSPLANHTGA
jgi:hypothetical protein